MELTPCLPGMPPSERPASHTDAAALFGLSATEFAALPSWKQRQLAMMVPKDITDVCSSLSQTTSAASQTMSAAASLLTEATAMATVVASADLMALVLEHITAGKVQNPALHGGHDEEVKKQYGVPLVCLCCKTRKPQAPADFCTGHGEPRCKPSRCKTCKTQAGVAEFNYFYCQDACRQTGRKAAAAAALARASVPAAVCSIWEQASTEAELLRLASEEREASLQWLRLRDGMVVSYEQRRQRLIVSKVDLERPLSGNNPRQLTALFAAAESGHAVLVRLLLEAGASPRLPGVDPKSLSPLTLAAAKGSVRVVKVLLDAGVDGGRQAARQAAASSKQIQAPMVAALLDGDTEGLWRLIAEAPSVGCGSFLGVRRLLLAGMRPPRTAAVHAARLGKTSVAKMLLRATARAEQPLARADAVEAAASALCFETVASLSRRALSDVEALCVAVKQGDASRAAMLLDTAARGEQPAPANQRDLANAQVWGTRPLMLARTAACAALLLGAGARPEATDANGRTALAAQLATWQATPSYRTYAQAKESWQSKDEWRSSQPPRRDEVVTLLTSMQPHCQLIVAARDGKVDAVRSLLDAKVDPNCADEEFGIDQLAEAIAQREGDRSYDEDYHFCRDLLGAWTPLVAAARKGHEACALLLLDAGARVALRVALDYAILNGTEGLIERLLAAGALTAECTSAQEPERRTPAKAILGAARGGHVTMTKRLLDEYRRIGVVIPADEALVATVDVTFDITLPPVGDGGREEIVSLLIGAGATKEAMSTALCAAAKDGREELARALLEAGADVDTTRSLFGFTPLIEAAQNKHEAVVRLLIEAGANLAYRHTDESSPKQRAPLPWARRKGSKLRHREARAAGRKAIDFAASPTCVRVEYSGYGNAAIIELLKQGAGLVKATRARFEMGKALYAAAGKGDAERVRQLLGECEKVTAVEKQLVLEYRSGGEGESWLVAFRTPLIKAAVNGHAHVVTLLLGAKADTKARDSKGSRAMSEAAANGHTAVIESLLEGNADIQLDLSDLDDWNPLMHAAHQGHAAAVKVLLRAKASTEVQAGGVGATRVGISRDSYALMLAAERGFTDVVSQLLRAGARQEKREWDCATPQSLAKKRGHTEVLKLLETSTTKVVPRVKETTEDFWLRFTGGRCNCGNSRCSACCFGPASTVALADGTLKRVDCVEVGDVLLTGAAAHVHVRDGDATRGNGDATRGSGYAYAAVRAVHAYPVSDAGWRACAVGELLLSPNHPLCVGGVWRLPRELAPPQCVRGVSAVYNFELGCRRAEDRCLLVNGIRCATLGWGDDAASRVYEQGDAAKRADAIWGRGYGDRAARNAILRSLRATGAGEVAEDVAEEVAGEVAEEKVAPCSACALFADEESTEEMGAHGAAEKMHDVLLPALLGCASSPPEERMRTASGPGTYAAQDGPGRLTPKLLMQLHAAMRLSGGGGKYRERPVMLGALSERHVPPPAADVPRLVNAFCELHERLQVQGGAPWGRECGSGDSGDSGGGGDGGSGGGGDFLDAALALWWVNHVHPFTDGNGRTARALALLVLARSDRLIRERVLPSSFHALFHRPSTRRRYLAGLRAANAAAGLCHCCSMAPPAEDESRIWAVGSSMRAQATVAPLAELLRELVEELLLPRTEDVHTGGVGSAGDVRMASSAA
jgi:ankyrin repeat protein